LTGHFVLHSFSEIENEVKTVGNLLRLRRATPGSIGVQTVPVSADEFHSGALQARVNDSCAAPMERLPVERARQISCTIIGHCDIASDPIADAASPVFPFSLDR
jgi:hypothetical protein